MNMMVPQLHNLQNPWQQAYKWDMNMRRSHQQTFKLKINQSNSHIWQRKYHSQSHLLKSKCTNCISSDISTSTVAWGRVCKQKNKYPGFSSKPCAEVEFTFIRSSMYKRQQNIEVDIFTWTRINGKSTPPEGVFPEPYNCSFRWIRFCRPTYLICQKKQHKKLGRWASIKNINK